MNYLFFCLFLMVPNLTSAGGAFFGFINKSVKKIEANFDKNFPACKQYKKYIISGFAVALVAVPVLYFSRSYFLNSKNIIFINR